LKKLNIAIVENLNKEFYTAEELAEILQVAPITIRRMAKRGEISFYLIGKQQRFSREDFLRFLESRKNKAKEQTAK
jgi:excisionase family DNA binding protein